MRTFVYKRTHKGDPDSEGRFGIEDCMGRLRKCYFEAVIGIGGISAWPRDRDIRRKVNWVGIGPRKVPFAGRRGPLVTFDHFVLFEEEGADFQAVAPTLARRLYQSKAARYLFSDRFNQTEQAEVRRILRLAENSPSSTRATYSKRRRIRCSECLRGVLPA